MAKSPFSLLGGFRFFFAPQPCRDCHQMFPLDQLNPIVAPNGQLIGWRCRERR